MIEDASVGIAMLRMCSVELVADDGSTASPGKVVIPHSPHLKWLQMQRVHNAGSQTQYKVTIGMDPTCYAQQIPAPLQNGAQVRFHSVLYQVGVDIGQCGVNASASTKREIKGSVDSLKSGKETASSDASTVTASTSGNTPAAQGGLLDDEDDDIGVEDTDELVALNYEALRKINAYAHIISPMPLSAPNTNAAVLMSDSGQQQSVHPALTQLHAHIESSSGRINHGILDEAAQVAEKLGGGCAVFCKSGKDRTAMHVTFKQAQYVHSYLQFSGRGAPDIYEVATRMRILWNR